MTNSTHLYLQEVLGKNRLSILDKFLYFKNNGFILGGGTALALLLGHRESIDFDFFISKDIDTKELFEKCLEIFSGFQVIKTYEEKNTLYILVNDIKISFFTYKHKNIGEIIDSEYFNIFSIKDIGAMKLWAIQNRATNKDYVDLYYIIKNIGLDNLIDSFFEKFGNVVTKSYILKSLVYFEDIDEEKLILKDKKITFKKVKTYLEKEIQNI